MFEIDRKQPLTIGNLVQIIMIAVGIGGVLYKVNNMETMYASKAVVDEAVRELAAHDKDIDDFKSQNIVYRLGLQEQAIVAGDQRQSRFVESFGKKVDTLVDGVNEFRTETKVLSTEVKALSATVKELSASPKRMRFQPSALRALSPSPVSIVK